MDKHLKFYLKWATILNVLLLIVVMLSMCEPASAASGKEMTKKFEGFRAYPYECSAGVKTVGYGFNMESSQRFLPREVLSEERPITRAEAEIVFDALYEIAIEEARDFVGNDAFDALSPLQKDILTDMAYNLGFYRLSQFKLMRKAIIAKDYREAAYEMKDSHWYHQTGQRARHHVAKFGGER